MKATVIGSGFGGLGAALRLQKQGFDVTILEKRDKAGGRAYVIKEDGFTFDCGPTIITAPYLIDELFELFDKKTEDYVNIKAISPYYRIYFSDKTYFNYTGDFDSQVLEIEKISPDDAKNYKAFVDETEKILQKGYVELGDHPFESIWDMLKIAPDLITLDLIKNMYSYAAKFFKHEKIRRVFSFHSLLIGGNPLKVSSIYALIPALERKWGVHFAMGGTGAIVDALLKLFKENGGIIHFDSEVTEIKIEKNKARAIHVKSGDSYVTDLVVSNGDYAHTYKDLIDSKFRKVNSDRKIKRLNYSMSAFILFFGFKKTDDMDLAHHNIILSERYKELLEDIFDHKVLSEDFSQYLHIPTLTDPSLAPEGHHSAYTLIPVPNLQGKIDWNIEADVFKKRIIDFLDKDYIHSLKENLVYTKVFTPKDFKSELNSYLGTGWGVEPRLTQSASFRPHNRSEDIKNLYLVGANTHPGAGVPGVLTTAKLTSRLIAEDYKNGK